MYIFQARIFALLHKQLSRVFFRASNAVKSSRVDKFLTFPNSIDLVQLKIKPSAYGSIRRREIINSV